MADTQLTRAEFFGAPVRIIDHAGQRWLTAEEVGLCLGYNEANARQGIGHLYRRHEDEFTADDTCEVNLTSQGQIRAMRIFSATGCTKLGFFANTGRAKDFRAWAAKVLTAPRPQGEGRTAVAVFTPPPRLPGQPRITRQLERLIFEMFVAGHVIKDIGSHLRISRTAASLVLHGKYQFGPNAGAPEAPAELIAAVAARHLALEQERLAIAQERISQRYLNTANNQTLAMALEQVGRQLQRRPAAALAAPKVEG